jgi:hypothetical protein
VSQDQDAQVIKSALGTHLAYLRAAEIGHRAAGRALSQHPQLSHLVAQQRSPIARSAAHRARGASFGQRAEFVEQLLDFPVSGLRSLTSGDMRSLQVPAHIGATAVPTQVGEAIADREAAARLAGAQPATRPAGNTADHSAVTEAAASDRSPGGNEQPAPGPPQRSSPGFRRSFGDLLRRK